MFSFIEDFRSTRSGLLRRGEATATMSVRGTALRTGSITAAALLALGTWTLSHAQAPAGQGAGAAAQAGQTPGRGAAAGGAQAGQPGAPGGGRGGFGAASPPFDYNNNEGWISLFNGTDLTGWDGDTRFWSVKDDAIYVEPTCEKPTGTIYLVWQGGELSDFMLKWESKGTGSVNGGVQFRSYLTADPNVDKRYYGRGGGGTLVPTAAAAAAAAARGGAAGFGGPGGRGAAGQAGQAGRGAAGAAGAGRGPQTGPCPSGQPRGTPPSRAEEAK